MSVNKVNLNSYSIGNNRMGTAKRKEEEQETQETVQENLTQSAKPEDVMSALNVAGAQNFAFVSKSLNTDGIDSFEKAVENLGEDRANDIEAMMAEFESGVDKIADIIDEDFAGVFSEAEKNALAAKVFESYTA